MAREFKVPIIDGMVVGAENFGLWCIEGGKRRKVPDLVTEIKMGICMDRVVMLHARELLEIPEGDPMPKIPLRRRGGRPRKWGKIP